MKKTILAIALVFNFLEVFPQSYLAMVRPANSDEWTYVDINGNQLVKPRYRKCFSFVPEGVALVYNEETLNYELLKADGTILIPEEKIVALKMRSDFGGGSFDFSNGMLPVKLGNYKWGYMNTKGEVAIEAEFDDVGPFGSNVAIASNGLGTSTRRYLINRKGEKTLIEMDKLKELKPFQEEMGVFYLRGRKAGFINENGDIVINPVFKSVGYFSGGVAWAKLIDGRIGFMDKKGDWVVLPIFEVAKDFDPISGIALVRPVDGKYQYINLKGEKISVPGTAPYHSFVNGACIGRSESYYGFYGSDGNWMVEPKFEGLRNFKNGYAAAKLNGLWGYIDKNGDWVLKPQFAAVKDFERVD
ncbi:WG repeat-containing protein [Reichenbachiella ulvae]|uniref:WG repeat-containing protein n=1 Tax=Reichenbachiella ulvae TaxID=2980104 RepID=A0ABT3CPV2_9BACT|nr:WG repeat-containing protein [Reichenbachiella ulvae]MCV9385494.1 WG repeat-containing protein [Reichenbachiella ulvae]